MSVQQMGKKRVKMTYKIEEHACKIYIWLKTRNHNKLNSVGKKVYSQISIDISQRKTMANRHVEKKIFDITSHQGDETQNINELSSHTDSTGLNKSKPKLKR